MKNDLLTLVSPWAEVKEKLKEANVELTDDDLIYNEMDPKPMLIHLSEKTKMSIEEVRAWIESVATNKGKAS